MFDAGSLNNLFLRIIGISVNSDLGNTEKHAQRQKHTQYDNDKSQDWSQRIPSFYGMRGMCMCSGSCPFDGIDFAFLIFHSIHHT